MSELETVISRSRRALPIKCAYIPCHAFLVSAGAVGDIGLCTVSWCIPVSIDPPLLIMAMRKSRHTYGVIQRYRCFTINVPGPEDVSIVDRAGQISGNTEDKIQSLDIDIRKAAKINSINVVRCPLNIECELEETLSVGTHKQIIGKLVHIETTQKAVSPASNDRLYVPTIGYLDKTYYASGSRLEAYGHTQEGVS